MPTPLFELRNITCQYPAQPGSDPRNVLDKLDFSFATGTRAGLIGPNGSGKSTLFHTILGLMKPVDGTVLFKGEPVNTDQRLTELRRSIGLLFQDSDDQLFNPTVLEDVAFGPLNLGMKPCQARERAMETIGMLGLSGFEERITHKLSGGEKKLVALATVLAMRPAALLLDEPTNNLDPSTRDRLIAMLKGLDVSLFVISHDLDFLTQTTEGTFTLKDGRIQSKTISVHTHVHMHEHGDTPHVHGNGVTHGHGHTHAHCDCEAHLHHEHTHTHDGMEHTHSHRHAPGEVHDHEHDHGHEHESEDKKD